MTLVRPSPRLPATIAPLLRCGRSASGQKLRDGRARAAVLRGLLVMLGVAVVLGGCGFQPVYMPTASGRPGPAERNLAAVQVDIIGDRPGQLLRQALQTRFGGDAGTTSQRYHLSVAYAISGEALGIVTGDVASRVRLTGRATWTLIANDAAQTPVTSGSARAIDGFNTLDQQYFAADLDTEAVQRRLATRIADDIAMQLAVYFRRQAALAAR